MKNIGIIKKIKNLVKTKVHQEEGQNYDKKTEACFHPTNARVLTHRGIYCGACGKRF